MAFIEPVPNYQYGQYADRDLKTKGGAKHPNPVAATNPLQNPPQYHLDRKERAGGRRLKAERIAVEKARKRDPEELKNICRDLTGKGIHIDVRI